jgi:hypothetical protein
MSWEVTPPAILTVWCTEADEQEIKRQDQSSASDRPDNKMTGTIVIKYIVKAQLQVRKNRQPRNLKEVLQELLLPTNA